MNNATNEELYDKELNEAIELFNNSFEAKSISGEEVGNRLREAINTYNDITGFNFSQTDIAKILHLSPSKISGMLNGERPPSLDQLVDLANLLHVSTDYLLGLNDTYKTDLYGSALYEDEEKIHITGLSQKSIINLEKFHNSKSGTFITDSLFRNYNINYFIISRNGKRTTIPKNIFNHDYSMYVPNAPITILEIPIQLMLKLIKVGISNIAKLLFTSDYVLSQEGTLSIEEIKTVKESVKEYLDICFNEKDKQPETGRALYDVFTCNYSEELNFLNSIIEDYNAFLSIEKTVSNIRIYERHYKLLSNSLNDIEDSINTIKKEYSSDFRSYPENVEKEYSDLINTKTQYKSLLNLYSGKIELSNIELHNSIQRAIKRYIEKKNVTVKPSTALPSAR